MFDGSLTFSGGYLFLNVEDGEQVLRELLDDGWCARWGTGNQCHDSCLHVLCCDLHVFLFLNFSQKMNSLSKESQHPLPPPPPLAPVTTKSEVAETCHYLLSLSCMICFKRYVHIICEIT